MIDVLILSFIQGVTEFLPVSSSSHLILFSEFAKFENKSLGIDVSLHIGSFLAIVSYFYKEIFDFVKNKKLFLKVLISSFPVIFFGFILVQTNLIDELRNIKIIAWTTFLFGILLYLSDKFNSGKSIKNDLSYKIVIIVGFFQSLSLISGVSRSGIAITVSRFFKFDRVEAAKISFLFSIPILGAVSIYGINDIISSPDVNFSILSFFAIFLSFIFSFLTIKYFLKFLESFSLTIFAVYRIILGGILLFLAYS